MPETDRSPEYNQYDPGSSLIERLINVLTDFSQNARGSAGQSAYDAAVEQQRSRALINIQAQTMATSPMAQMLGLNPNSSALLLGGKLAGDSNGQLAQLMKQMTGSNPMLSAQLEYSNRTGSTYASMYGKFGNISPQQVLQDQTQMMQFMHYSHQVSSSEALADNKKEFTNFQRNNGLVTSLFGSKLEDAKLDTEKFRKIQSFVGEGFNKSGLASALGIDVGDIDKLGINKDNLGKKAQEVINAVNNYKANNDLFKSGKGLPPRIGGEDYSRTYGVSMERAEATADYLGGSGRLKAKDISTNEGKAELFKLTAAAQELTPELSGGESMKVLSQQMGNQSASMTEMTKFANDIKSLSTITGQKVSTLLSINKVIRETLIANPAFQGMDLGLTASDITNQSTKQAMLLQTNMSSQDITRSGGPSGIQNGVISGQTTLAQDRNTLGIAGMRKLIALKFKEGSDEQKKALAKFDTAVSNNNDSSQIFNDIAKTGLATNDELGYAYGNEDLQRAGTLDYGKQVQQIANGQITSIFKNQLQQLDVNDPIRRDAGRKNGIDYLAEISAAYKKDPNKYEGIYSYANVAMQMDKSGNTLSMFAGNANGLNTDRINKLQESITAQRETYLGTHGAMQQTALQNIINDIDVTKPDVLGNTIEQFRKQNYDSKGKLSVPLDQLTNGLSAFSKDKDINNLLTSFGKKVDPSNLTEFLNTVKYAQSSTPEGSTISATLKSLAATNPDAMKTYQTAFGGNLSDDTLNQIASSSGDPTILAKIAAQQKVKEVMQEKDEPLKVKYAKQEVAMFNDPKNKEALDAIKSKTGSTSIDDIIAANRAGKLSDITTPGAQDFLDDLTTTQGGIDQLNQDEDSASQYTKKDDDKKDDVSKDILAAMNKLQGVLTSLIGGSG